jgi:hypothetical protein
MTWGQGGAVTHPPAKMAALPASGAGVVASPRVAEDEQGRHQLLERQHQAHDGKS